MRTALSLAALLLLAPGARAQTPSNRSATPGAAGSTPRPVAAAADDAGVPLPSAPPLAPPQALPPIPRGMGRVAGHVRLADTAAAPTPSNSPRASVERGSAAEKELEICGAEQPSPSVKIGRDGGLLEAVLWAPDGPPPEKGARAEVTIRGCQFTPHVLALGAGADFILRNGDALYHNVTGTGPAQFSYAMVLKNHSVPVHLKRAGLLVLESKNHPWMRGYVQSVPTSAFAMTDTDGSYFIDLPPGKHAIHLWHEQLGAREVTVEIAQGSTAIQDFALAPQ